MPPTARTARRLAVAGAGALAALIAAGVAIASLPSGPTLPDAAPSSRPAASSSAGPAGPASTPSVQIDPANPGFPAAVVAAYQRCEDGGKDYAASMACWDDTSTTLLASAGIEAVPVILAAVADSPVRMCHEASHALGMAAWHLAKDPRDVISPGIQLRCQQGYQHGAMQAASADLDTDQLTAAIDTMCASASDDVTGTQAFERRRLCLHGSGHALMLLPGAEITTALERCTRWEGRLGEECQSAVTMEWARQWMLATTPADRPAGPADPLGVCLLLDPSDPLVLQDCYTAIASVLRQDPPTDMVAWCDANDPSRHDDCVDGIAGSFATYAPTMPKIAALCQALPGEHATRCVDRAAYLMAARSRLDGDMLCADLPAAEQAAACSTGLARYRDELVVQGDVPA